MRDVIRKCNLYRTDRQLPELRCLAPAEDPRDAAKEGRRRGEQRRIRFFRKCHLSPLTCARFFRVIFLLPSPYFDVNPGILEPPIIRGACVSLIYLRRLGPVLNPLCGSRPSPPRRLNLDPFPPAFSYSRGGARPTSFLREVRSPFFFSSRPMIMLELAPRMTGSQGECSTQMNETSGAPGNRVFIARAAR